jgi:hypothetical protein
MSFTVCAVSAWQVIPSTAVAPWKKEAEQQPASVNTWHSALLLPTAPDSISA